ncbi:CPBP family intramembrane metalloprotease [bacterium]|nr:CPBP family intramembrane metalloprotease [bacterium]
MTLALFALTLGCGLPPLIAWATTRGDPAARPMWLRVAGLIAFAGAAGSGLALALGPGGFSPAELGFVMPGWTTLAWAAGIAGFFSLWFGGVLMRLPARLGLKGFEAGAAAFGQAPPWLMVAGVVVGVAAEDILFTGVALAWLDRLVGDPVIATLVGVTIFALAHLPMWGVGPTVTFFISRGVLMGLYRIHGDLGANILGHIVTDFIGLALSPTLAALARRRSDR